MRLKRLDLTRYGKFTGRSLDFGEAAPGLPDLHLVYGPNESGKSTALSAYLDLLFGIPAQSPYDFLHPYPTLRIGAALDLAGGAREFVRIKRAQNSLLDARDQPIAESAILGELGGIDRDAYRTMFSLDDETLEAGGESILASKGDLGQLLFSASAGLADLGRRLGEVRSGAERFYKYRARSGELAELKARLAALKAERETADTLATDHARLVEQRDSAAAQYEGAIAERGRIQSRIDEIRRHLNSLPRLAALRGLRERLLPLADLPEAPRHWIDAVAALQAEQIALAVRSQGAAAAVEQATMERDAGAVDEVLLALAERIERLADGRARYVTAEKDLPERRLQLRSVELAIAGLLARLEQSAEPEPGRLLLGASTLGRLRELIEARSGVEAALGAAASELAAARGRALEAEARLEEAGGEADEGPGAASAMASLAATLGALRGADHAARKRLAERAGEAARALLEERLLALRPWQGSAEELAVLPVPDRSSIERWRSAQEEIAARLDRQAADAERLKSDCLRLDAERTAVAASSGVVTDQQAATVRLQREAAWAAHRRSLDADSADLFEAALRQDDVVTAGRQGHLAEVAKLGQIAQSLAVAQAGLDRAVELRTAAQAALDALHEDIAASLRAMAPSLAAALSLPRLDAWLASRDRALEARDAVHAAARDLRDAEADAVTARDRVATALQAAGLPQDTDASFERLLLAAETALGRQEELKALRGAVQQCQRDLAARARVADRATAAEQAWTTAWATTCAACWLGEGGTVPSLATVRESLVALAELAPALERSAGLTDRIGKMMADQAAFAEEVAVLAGEAAMPASAVATLDLAQRLAERLRLASEQHARRAKAIEALSAAQARQRELAEASEIHDRRRAEMTQFFGVTTLAEVAATLTALEKRTDLRSQVEQAEHDLLDALGLSEVAAAEATLDLVDRAGLEAELAELTARFDDQDMRCRQLFASHSQARDRVEAIGGDSRVAEIEEQRRTTLLEIAEGAQRYLRLRAGAAATEQALRAYREAHRSSMLSQASRAFRTLSRDAYGGLASQPAKDGESLIALPAGGGSKQATELSKGTRFQLYLALRVAGYHEFVAARSPVPFIADDIMETFDDFRAEEAFRLFADMARVGQVIYLTHHRHLCDIARQVCPTVTVHELSSDDPGASGAP